jgi:hypothetical protein
MALVSAPHLTEHCNSQYLLHANTGWRVIIYQAHALFTPCSHTWQYSSLRNNLSEFYGAGYAWQTLPSRSFYDQITCIYSNRACGNHRLHTVSLPALCITSNNCKSIPNFISPGMEALRLRKFRKLHSRYLLGISNHHFLALQVNRLREYLISFILFLDILRWNTTESHSIHEYRLRENTSLEGYSSLAFTDAALTQAPSPGDISFIVLCVQCKTLPSNYSYRICGLPLTQCRKHRHI